MFKAQTTENVWVAFAKEDKFSCNSSQFDLSSATPDHVSLNKGRCRGTRWWNGSQWLPKEAIRETNRLWVTCSSHGVMFLKGRDQTTFSQVHPKH